MLFIGKGLLTHDPKNLKTKEFHAMVLRLVPQGVPLVLVMDLQRFSKKSQMIGLTQTDNDYWVESE